MSAGEATVQVALWYVALSALGWISYPILHRACSVLPDGGLALVRPAGLLLTIVPIWWLADTFGLPYTASSIGLTAGIVGLAGWGYELARPQALPFLRRHWRLVFALETLSAAAFALYVVFRGFHPDIAYTEKPMDLALLSSAIRTDRLPVPDPWFSGEPVNYYVLGYVLAASLAKLTGTLPEVAFNLELATIFALAVTGAFGIGLNLAHLWMPDGPPRRAWIGGAAAALLLVGLGNLYTPWQLVKSPEATLDASWWQGIGWRASRVIVDSGFPWDGEPRPTINEFPAFSFVLGDLHPHLLGLPLLLLVVALALALILSPLNLWTLLLAGLVVGSSYAVNSWDMPTAALISLAALLASRTVARAVSKLLGAGSLLLIAAIVSLPFSRRYVPSFGADAALVPEPLASLPIVGSLVRTLGIVIWSRSSLGELLLVHGLFLLLGWALAAYVLLRLPERMRPTPAVAIATIGLVAALAFVARFPALVLFALPAAFLLWSSSAPGLPNPERFVAIVIGICWSLITAVEIFYLQDAFGDRMNTVFKVYFQAWALQAVVLGGAAPVVIARLLAHQRWLGVGIMVTAGVLALGTATYLPISAYRWTDGFARWTGLDGLRYLEEVAPDEMAAIAWLRAQAQRNAVVVEAPGCSYGVTYGMPHNRVSMASGIPTILGWGGHEYQWRRGDPVNLAELEQRRQEVASIFDGADTGSIEALLERYRVTFVYIGMLERYGLGQQCTTLQETDARGLQHTLESIGWHPLFARGEVVIYGRP